MKRPRWICAAILLMLSAPILRSDASLFEFGMKVQLNGQNVALPVYLYRYGDLSFPYRLGATTTETGVNFQCDIDEGPANPQFHYPVEPNTPDPTFSVITPGHYWLRVGGWFVELEIKNYPEYERDFLLTFETDSFTVSSGNRGILHGRGTLWTEQTVNALVDQKLSDLSSVGEVFRYSPVLEAFEPLPRAIPVAIPMSNYSTQFFRGEQAIQNNEKYNNWLGLIDVTNHHGFYIEPTTSALVSNFRLTRDGIQIRAALSDAPAAFGGEIEFRDPWYIDFQDADHANSWRNRGMTSAAYRSRNVGSSGFSPDLSTIYPESPYPYNGVFLNQGNPPLWSPPYYSVGVPQTQTINGVESYFLGWSAHLDSAVLRSSDKDTSAVVFKEAGASVTATYKGHLRTGTPLLSDPKNQRRVVSAVGSSSVNWYTVYESMGDIWITYSSNNGATWDKEERLNVHPGLATNPTIAVCPYGWSGNSYVLVSWLEQNGGAYETHLQTMMFTTYGGHHFFGWNSQNGERSSDNHKTLGDFGLPEPRPDSRITLHLDPTAAGIYMIYAYESATNGLRGGKILFPDAGGNSVSDLNGAYIPSGNIRTLSTNSGDGCPVVISYPAAFGYPARTCIYYLAGGYAAGKRIAQYDYGTGQTAVLPTGYLDYTYTSIQGAANPSSASFALVAQGTDTYLRSFVNYYSKPTYYGSSAPSLAISYLHMRQPTVMVENSSSFGSPTLEIDMVSTGDSTWYKSSGSTSLTTMGSLTAGIFARASVGSSDRASMVVRTAVTPSRIDYYSGTGQFAKSAGPVAVDLKAIRYWGDAQGNGRIGVLDFSDSNVEMVDSLEKDGIVCAAHLIEIPSNAPFVKQKDTLALALAVDLNRGGLIIFSYAPSAWTSLDVQSSLPATAGDIVKFSAPERAIGLWGYEQVSLRMGVLAKEVDSHQPGDQLKERLGTLSVFPNPFNPTTTIRFELSTPGYVTLSVSDVLGRHVADLVQGPMDAGVHSLIWDGSKSASGAYIVRYVALDNKGAVKVNQASRVLLLK